MTTMKHQKPRKITIHNHTTSTTHTLKKSIHSTLSELRITLTTARHIHPDDIFVLPHGHHEFVVPREREPLCPVERITRTRNWHDVTEEPVVDEDWYLDQDFVPEADWIYVYLNEQPCCTFERPVTMRVLADLRAVLAGMGVMTPGDVFLNSDRRRGKQSGSRYVRMPMVRMEREAETEVVGNEVYIQFGDVRDIQLGDAMEVDSLMTVNVEARVDDEDDEAYESRGSSPRSADSNVGSPEDEMWMEGDEKNSKRKRVCRQPANTSPKHPSVKGGKSKSQPRGRKLRAKVSN